jgi:hypothetical protein
LPASCWAKAGIDVDELVALADGVAAAGVCAAAIEDPMSVMPMERTAARDRDTELSVILTSTC